MRRPSERGPKACCKYSYEPPEPGIAAPNSAQTNPSHVESSAPKIQPSSACGPCIAERISGMVRNGPTPTICSMFAVRAGNRPMPRVRPDADISACDGFTRFEIAASPT